MKSGPSMERILCGADFTPALTFDEQENMLKHDPKIRSRSILRKELDDSEDYNRLKKSIAFQKRSSENGSSNEEMRSRSVFVNDEELFRRYSFVASKYYNESSEGEEDERMIEEDEKRKEEEERKLYEAKIKILAPFMVENDLPDAFLQQVLKNSADSCDLAEFKQSIENEIDLLQRNADSEEKKEEERKLSYRKRCRDINECIELGVVDWADDGLYNLAADRTISEAVWNHKINVLKKREMIEDLIVSDDQEKIEEYKGSVPTMKLHVEKNHIGDDELTERIVKDNKDKLVKMKGIQSENSGSKRNIEIFAVKEVDEFCLKEQVESLDFGNPDAARGQLNDIIESLHVLVKKLEQKRKRVWLI